MDEQEPPSQPEPEPEPSENNAPARALIDGPTLRELRKRRQVSMRVVARRAGMSHGHLSKVEAGEPGRPVTPAVLAAYQKALGVKLLAGEIEQGYLSPAGLRMYTGRVAAIAYGGSLGGDSMSRVLDGSGRFQLRNGILQDEDVAQLQRIADHLALLEGPMAGIAAQELLRWLARSFHQDEEQPGAHAVAAMLALRAAQTAEQIKGA